MSKLNCTLYFLPFLFIFSFLVNISHIYLNFGTNDLAYHETLIQLNMVLIKCNVNAFFHLEYFLICW